MHVCSRHFTDDSFRITRPGGPSFLKPQAVPSIFDVRDELKRSVPEIVVKKENDNPNEILFVDCSVPDAEILDTKESVVSTPNIKKNTANLSWSVPVVEMFISEDFITDASTSRDERIAVWRPHRVGVLVPEHFTTPRRAKRHLDMVKDAIAQKDKKIKVLQQKTRRLTKQVTSLLRFTQQLQEKNLISSSTEDVLQRYSRNEKSDSESDDDTNCVPYVPVKESV